MGPRYGNALQLGKTLPWPMEPSIPHLWALWSDTGCLRFSPVLSRLPGSGSWTSEQVRGSDWGLAPTTFSLAPHLHPLPSRARIFNFTPSLHSSSSCEVTSPRHIFLSKHTKNDPSPSLHHQQLERNSFHPSSPLLTLRSVESGFSILLSLYEIALSKTTVTE